MPQANDMLDRHGFTVLIGDRVRILNGDECIPTGTLLTVRSIDTSDGITRCRADDATSLAGSSAGIYEMAGRFAPAEVEVVQ